MCKQAQNQTFPHKQKLQQNARNKIFPFNKTSKKTKKKTTALLQPTNIPHKQNYFKKENIHLKQNNTQQQKKSKKKRTPNQN